MKSNTTHKLTKQATSSEADAVIPNHVGIILDGNRRWAKAHGKTVLQGHQAGADTLRKIANAAFERDIKEVSVYVFSTENWKRPASEVAALMKLIAQFIKRELKGFMKRDIRIRISGLRQRVEKRILREIDSAVELTKNNRGGVINFCFNYGGRADILRAVKRLIKKGVDSRDVNEASFSDELSTAGMHDVDLVIRTSEQRLSNFLPWETAYAEVYFLPERLWPDFSETDLDNALTFYASTQRRFGT